MEHLPKLQSLAETRPSLQAALGSDSISKGRPDAAAHTESFPGDPISPFLSATAQVSYYKDRYNVYFVID